MRRYLFGALILILGLCSRASSQYPDPSQGYRNPYFVLDIPEEVNNRDTSTASSGYEGDDHEAQRNVGQKYGDGYFGGNLPGDFESDPYQPRDDVAYWESIYGTEDVPDFEVPPPIDGDSIFMGIDDLTDAWEDRGEEVIPRKRDAGETGSHLGRTSSSVKQTRRNLENSRSSGNLDYRSMMTDVYQPHFYEQNSWRAPKTSSTFGDDQNEQLYGSRGSARTTYSSNLQPETAWASNNVRRPETHGSDIEDSGDVDAEMKSELEFTARFPTALDSRSTKSSHFLSNSKQRVIQAKKDLINVAAGGGGRAKISDAVHRTIEAKKDFIDSVMSSKSSAIQHKKEHTHSITGLDHSHHYSGNSQISGHIHSQGALQSVLDSKQKVIQAKKDLLHASSAGSKAELTDALIGTLDAKKELVDSLLSTGSGSTDRMSHSERESIDKKLKHSITDFDHSHGHSVSGHTSGHVQSQEKLQSILESKQKVIQAKKDLLHASAVGSKAELTDALIGTLDAKKDLVDSLLSTGSGSSDKMSHSAKESIDKKLVHSITSLDHSHGHSVSGQTSGHVQSQGTLQSILDSKQKVIQAKKDLLHASAVGSQAELTDALIGTLDAKKDLVDSLLSTGSGKTSHTERESIDKKLIHSITGSDHSHGHSVSGQTSGHVHSQGTLQSILDSKQKAIQAMKDLIPAAVADGKAELTEGVLETLLENKDHLDSLLTTSAKIDGKMIEAKKDLIDSVISAKAGAIQNKKEFVHSTSDFNHRHSHSGHTRISGSTRYKGSRQSVLDSTRKVIQAKKDLIHVSATGSGAEVTDAVIKTLDAKKDLLDSLLPTRAGMIHDKKKFSHSTCCSTNTAENSFSVGYHTEGASPNPDSQVSGQIYANLQSGSLHDHHKLHETEHSSDFTTIQDKISSLHSSLSAASDIAIGGEAGVASSPSHDDHKEKSSLVLNKKIESGTRISGSLESGQSKVHSLETPHQINLPNAENSGKEFSLDVTTNLEKHNSLHPSLSKASDIAIGGEIGVAGSLSHSNQKVEGSLTISKKIEGNTQINNGQDLGPVLIKIEDDSPESSDPVNSPETEDGETKLPIVTVIGTVDIATDGEPEVAISVSDSSSEESSEDESDSESKEIQSSVLLDFPSTKLVPKTEVDVNTDIKSSINLGDKNLIHFGLQSEGSITSGISTQSSTKPVTIVEEKSLQKSSKECPALGVAEIFGTDHKIDLQPIHKECAPGQCGITGKLHVELNTKSDVSLHHQNEPDIVVESKIPEYVGSSEDDEEIMEVSIPSPVSDAVIVNSGFVDEKSKEIVNHENYGADFEANEHKPAVENVIERVPDGDDHLVIDDEGNQLTEAISSTKNIEIAGDADDGDVVYELHDSRREDAIPEYEEGAISHEEEPEIIGGKSVLEFEAQMDGDAELEAKQESAAIEKSSNSIIRSEIPEAEVAALQDEEAKNLAVEQNGKYLQASVKFGHLENNSSYGDYESLINEKRFGAQCPNAAHQHGESQKKGRISHFQWLGGSSHELLPEDVEELEANRAFANAHCRLINLDVNCSGMTAFMKPECQQLNANLWHPQNSDTPITLWTVKTYLSHGQELAMEMQSRARWLCDQGLVPKLHTPAMLHLINNFATETTVEINQESECSLFGTKLLQRRLFSHFDVTPNTFIEFLQHHSFRVIGTGLCYDRPKRCPLNQIYRTFDGSCNNQNHPTWGQSNTAFARVLPARYSDGVHQPPKSVTGSELPNPRVLSAHCFSRKMISNAKITLAVSQWGQVLSHDFGLQTIDQTVQGGIQCCEDGMQLPKSLQHHSCLPIDIPADDKFYSQFDTQCMNFVRSMTISREDCTLGPADQLNTVTSYLDASPLYGSNKETCDQLRAFKGGRMLVAVRRGRELLPTMINTTRFCDVMSPGEVCYLAGDVRVNQNPQLAILQTTLLREHNRIADELTVLNPHWDDERVFQEARKIVIAEYQHITYNEWLPSVIGKKYCQRHRLISRCQDLTSRAYDPKIKASTINGFTTGVFRSFHSMVAGNINLCPASREISHTLRLSNHYFRPQIIERSNNLDDLIRGLVSQPMQEADENFDPEITEYLFRSRNEFGLDLEALDIQRGRDHGLPSYNAYRKTCGLPRAKDFDDLKQEITQKNIEKLKKFYAHVDDIDLIVGTVMENASPGSLLGPVARCLIGEQFYRSRVGDRHFYDIANQPHSFTQEQFKEIKKASFARLLCDTGDNLREIQPQAFRMISPRNPLTCCYALPKIDLSPWQESNY